MRILPMSDERVESRVTVDGTEIGFPEYFVGKQHGVPVEGVRFAGVEEAVPAPHVLEAIAEADAVVVCPSNPIVSIGPILAVPRLRDAVAARREQVVAVSPIVGGKALKGPADRMMTELGHEASVVGVARLLADVAGTLVIDKVDADRADDVEREGTRCVVTETVMHDVDVAASLARTVLDAAGIRP